MKILYIAHEGKLGGASKSLLTLVEHMSQKGHEVTVLMPFFRCELREQLESIPNIEKEYIFYTWWQYPSNTGICLKFAFILGYFYNFIAQFFLWIKFRNKKYDIIHSNSSVINIGAKLARRLGAKYVWHFREFGEQDLGLKYILGKKYSMNYVAKHTDRVIFISKALEQYYHRWLPHDLGVVVYNGIKSKYLLKKNEEDYCINDKVNFLISGALQKGKGHECVIRAAHELLDRGFTNFKVMIAGRDICGYQAVLQHMVLDYKLLEKIEFLGYVKDILTLRSEADIELVCSTSEAFGRVTIEAMMASNPVIASNSGANPELIESGVNGLLFKCDDYVELADCMERLMRNRQEIIKMGQLAYEYAKDRFYSEKNADEIEELYHKLLN